MDLCKSFLHAFVYREEAYIHPAGVQIINHLFKEGDEEEPQRNWGIIYTIAIWRVCISRYTPIKESNACSDISESRHIHYTAHDDDDHDA